MCIINNINLYTNFNIYIKINISLIIINYLLVQLLLFDNT